MTKIEQDKREENKAEKLYFSIALTLYMVYYMGVKGMSLTEALRVKHTMKRTKSMYYHPTTESIELTLFITNDYETYKSIGRYTDNLARKLANGSFDRDKAVDGFYTIACEGAKRYIAEVCTPCRVDSIFSVTDRFTTADDLMAYSADEIMEKASNLKDCENCEKWSVFVEYTKTYEEQEKGISKYTYFYNLNIRAALETYWDCVSNHKELNRVALFYDNKNGKHNLMKHHSNYTPIF